jgi:glycosyltransferase involved in cell wall biosynthesis
VVIPNYVLPISSELAEREPGLIVFAGSLVARKRVDILINAVAALGLADSKVKLEILGDGPERLVLETLARDLHAPVVFRGRLPHRETLARMCACQIYVQASSLEGHPKAVIEAMACGAPVIVADSPGLGPVVHHGVTGLRCAGDVQSFTHVMQELLADDDWRQVLGSSGARLAESTYGLSTISQLEADVHRRAMNLVMTRNAKAA